MREYCTHTHPVPYALLKVKPWTYDSFFHHHISIKNGCFDWNMFTYLVKKAIFQLINKHLNHVTDFCKITRSAVNAWDANWLLSMHTLSPLQQNQFYYRIAGDCVVLSIRITMKRGDVAVQNRTELYWTDLTDFHSSKIDVHWFFVVARVVVYSCTLINFSNWFYFKLEAFDQSIRKHRSLVRIFANHESVVIFFR